MNEIANKLGVNIDVSFYLIFFALVWVRTLMMVSIVPFLFSKPVPKYAAVGIAAILALFVVMRIIPDNPPKIMNDNLYLIVLFMKEVFIGLSIGFAVSIFFQAFQSAGQMIDNQRGASIARLLIPQLGGQGSLFGSFLFQLGVVMFIAIGGHLVFLEGFFESFAKLPVLKFPASGMSLMPMIETFSTITAQIFLIALQLAAPIIISIFLVDIILGMTNRFAPQINVFQLGFIIRGYIGMLLVFLSILAISGEMQKYASKGVEISKQVVTTMATKPKTVPKEEKSIEVEKPIGVPKVKTIPGK